MLRQISAEMGKNPRLIQATGGNTSLKENGILWVKASGRNLADALYEDIFMPLDELHARAQVSFINPIDTPNFLSLFTDGNMRPSIETSLHALMPHRVVLHSHPVDVISLSLLPNSHPLLEELLSDITWHLIPYCRPGAPLAYQIALALSRKPADVLILANHGLVVGGSSPQDAYRLQAEVIHRLTQIPRPVRDINISELSEQACRFPGATIPRSSVIHSLATDPYSLELSALNPPYPDHAIFCGIHPWFTTKSDLPPTSDTTYGLIPGVGVILLEKATHATEAMLQAQAEVYLRLPPGIKVNLLTSAQCEELLKWEAETYRKTISNQG